MNRDLHNATLAAILSVLFGLQNTGNFTRWMKPKVIDILRWKVNKHSNTRVVKVDIMNYLFFLLRIIAVSELLFIWETSYVCFDQLSENTVLYSCQIHTVPRPLVIKDSV